LLPADAVESILDGSASAAITALHDEGPFGGERKQRGETLLYEFELESDN
jgi:hypothetical protein